MVTVQDQLGNTLVFRKSPQRIISLVPSLTETMCYLGFYHNIVGVTKFCIHPKGIKNKAKIVGGTKKIEIGVIRDLKPDFIIANKEENTKEDILSLLALYPVYISDIKDVSDLYRFLIDIDMVMGSYTGQELCQNITHTLDNLPKMSISIAYLIWLNPLMAVGSHTYIDSVISVLGMENIFKHIERYPSIDDINTLNKADVIFLSSEPFPFKQQHMDFLRSNGIYRPMLIVDGEIFSWYGSRTLSLAQYTQVLVRDIQTIQNT